MINPNNKTLLWIIRFFNDTLVSWWENLGFKVWKAIPLNIRRKLTFWAWRRLYLPLHKVLLGRSTGIHPDASLSYHALTTLMWPGRLFPVTVQRMRFSLSQLSVCSPPLPPDADLRIETIEQQEVSFPNHMSLPAAQRHHGKVSGLYIHNHNSKNNNNNNNNNNTPHCADYVLFWIYGGAFLAGDAAGNLGPAQPYAAGAGVDVFLPTHRLCPEAGMSDILWDVCLAYRWLVQYRKEQGHDPSKILVLGISSGGGLAVRLCQSIAECQQQEAVSTSTDASSDTEEAAAATGPLPDYLITALQDVPMPRGALLFGPFADYTTPSGSLLYYPEHDLIVNQRVLETGLPYLDTHMDGKRKEHSPVHRSFAHVPPLCVITSEHEAVYDHAIALVNRARQEGVPVTLGVWKFMCHVFPFLSSFIPEGEQATQFAIQWLREQQQQEQQTD